MGQRIPTYTIEQILKALAVASLYGPDILGDRDREILDRVANEWYWLDTSKPDQDDGK